MPASNKLLRFGWLSSLSRAQYPNRKTLRRRAPEANEKPCYVQQSHVIEVNGVFVGAAISTREGFRFIAVDPHVRAANGRCFATLAEARRYLAQLFRAKKLAAANA
ncbi:MAG: hypothetical protein K6U10_02065 [Acidobacteriia bacterium]|nr:hypothetical protein [Methyloceanibacter sp.]MBX5470853.1 hypothetical protein [Acetobacteraceae bacterium]MCL6490586.1 hypothetical protein [Terriglobia bacterium]